MVNLNPIMVDGTGMCGACRVTVNGQTYLPVWTGLSLMVMELTGQNILTGGKPSSVRKNRPYPVT